MPQEPGPKKTDRRVLYTKMFLRESLLALMREKPISRITPTELCRHAGINRNTFYAHYQSTEDLLFSIEEELYGKVRAALEQIGSGVSIRVLIAQVCATIIDNYDLSRILLSENGDTHFLERLINLAHDQTMVTWQSAGIRADAELLETLFTYTVNGSVAVIREWVRAGTPRPPQLIAEQLEQMTYGGLRSFEQ